jgi:proteasome lid subunit RPN8/RPN11
MARKHPRDQQRLYRFIREQLDGEVARAIRKAEPRGREICGLLIDNGFLIELLPLKNKTKRPGSFQLSWKQIRRAERAAGRLGHRVLGTYHSHPLSEAAPGESDIRGAHRSLMLVISCMDVEAKLWRIRKGGAEEVPFRAVAMDATTLITASGPERFRAAIIP